MWLITYLKENEKLYYFINNENNRPSSTSDKSLAKKFKTKKLAIGVAEIALITGLMINKNYVCTVEKFRNE